MLPIERVFARLQGNPVDYVPFAPLTSLIGAKLINCPLKTYFSEPKKYTQGQMAVVDAVEPDILFSPFAVVLEAQAFGTQIAEFEKNPPNVKIPALASFRDIPKLKLPDIENNAQLQFIRESTRLLAKQYKGQIPVAAVVNAPSELPALIMGIENWIDTLLFHPDEAQQLMKLISEHFVAFANALFDDGAMCIIAPASFSNPTIITFPIARDILVPVIRENFAKIKGPIVFHHGGARLLPFLELLHNLPNVVGFVFDPRDSFDDARAILGNEIAVMGNLNGQMLWRANKQIIESWTLNILENRRNDTRFILTTSNADIPYDTPIENVRVIMQTVRNLNR